MLMIKVKLGKQGNSLRMTVPDSVAKALGWKTGDCLEVGIIDDKMIVTRDRLNSCNKTNMEKEL